MPVCRWAVRLVARLDRSEQLALLPLTPVAGNAGGGVALLMELQLTRRLGHLLRVIGLSTFVKFSTASWPGTAGV